jgi:hypothetical protein
MTNIMNMACKHMKDMAVVQALTIDIAKTSEIHLCAALLSSPSTWRTMHMAKTTHLSQHCLFKQNTV